MRIFLGLRGDDLESQGLEQACRDRQVQGAHHPQDRHMTLCFLGDCSDEQQARLVMQLDAYLEQAPQKSILWPAQYIGELIPNKGHSNTCWAWQGVLSEDLRQLMQGLRQVTLLSGHLSLDGFLPHVTLAYCSGQTYGTLDYAKQVSLTQLVLYASQWGRSGDEDNTTLELAEPRYRVLKTWALQEDKPKDWAAAAATKSV